MLLRLAMWENTVRPPRKMLNIIGQYQYWMILANYCISIVQCLANNSNWNNIKQYQMIFHNISQYWTILCNIGQYQTDNIWQYLTILYNIRMFLSISQLRQERAEIAAWTILKNIEQYLKILDNIGQ